MDLKYPEIEEVVDMLALQLGRPPSLEEAQEALGSRGDSALIEQALNNWQPHHPEFMPGGISEKSRPIYYYGV